MGLACSLALAHLCVATTVASKSVKLEFLCQFLSFEETAEIMNEITWHRTKTNDHHADDNFSVFNRSTGS